MGSLKHKDDTVAGPEMSGNKLPLEALAMDVTSKGSSRDSGGRSERGKVVAGEGEAKWREKSGERERQLGLGGSFMRKLLVEGKLGPERERRAEWSGRARRERETVGEGETTKAGWELLAEGESMEEGERRIYGSGCCRERVSERRVATGG